MRKRLTNWAKIAVGLILSLGMGYFAVRGLEWGLVWENLTGVSLGLLLVAVTVFLIAGWLRAARWQVLFLNSPPSTMRLFIIQHEGLGLSNIMPIRVASEVTQIAVLTIKDGIRASTAVATIGMERVVDIFATTSVLGVALVFSPQLRVFAPYVWGAIAVAFSLLVGLRLFSWRSASFTLFQRFPALGAFATAVRELEHERGRLARSYLMSIGYWLMIGVCGWIVASALGLDVSPVTVTLVIMGTIFFSTAIPAAPSAIGTFHFAVVYVLGFVGVSKVDAFPFAVLVHVLFFLPPTIIAAVFLPREGINLRRPKLSPAPAAGAERQ